MWKEQIVKTDINAALFFKINVRMCHRIKFQIDQKTLILFAHDFKIEKTNVTGE